VQINDAGDFDAGLEGAVQPVGDVGEDHGVGAVGVVEAGGVDEEDGFVVDEGGVDVEVPGECVR